MTHAPQERKLAGNQVKNSRGTGYSLWLLPSVGQERLWIKRIHRLSRIWGVPLFRPHVTLLGSMSKAKFFLHQQTLILSRLLNPLVVNFYNVSSTALYFRAICLNAPRPARAILRSRELALSAMGLRRSVFQPHFSLVYGSFSKWDRQRIINGFRFDLPQSLRLNRLALVQTEGEVTSWKVLTVHRLR